METFASAEEVRDWSRDARGRGLTVGFVPTMGALHEGHLSLVEASVRECGATVVSIFVNPSQFGPDEDLDRYPRDLESDIEKLERAGCDLLFLPEAGAIYPADFETWVELETIPKHLCGLTRPDHFRGVATVVCKLFNIVEPDRAFFGWKDAQQGLLVRRMVRDLDFRIDVRLLPIVRDKDGLARSSRNAYLSEGERKKALLIPGAVERAKEYFSAGGRDADKLIGEIKKTFHRIEGVEIDYMTCIDMDTLEESTVLAEGKMLALAVRVGKTRLIDNCRFGTEQASPESR